MDQASCSEPKEVDESPVSSAYLHSTDEKDVASEEDATNEGDIVDQTKWIRTIGRNIKKLNQNMQEINQTVRSIQTRHRLLLVEESKKLVHTERRDKKILEIQMFVYIILIVQMVVLALFLTGGGSKTCDCHELW